MKIILKLSSIIIFSLSMSSYAAQDGNFVTLISSVSPDAIKNPNVRTLANQCVDAQEKRGSTSAKAKEVCDCNTKALIKYEDLVGKMLKHGPDGLGKGLVDSKKFEGFTLALEKCEIK